MTPGTQGAFFAIVLQITSEQHGRDEFSWCDPAHNRLAESAGEFLHVRPFHPSGGATGYL